MTGTDYTSGIDRRSVLRRGAVGLAGLAAVSGTASAYHELEDEYETVIDVVDEGADPDGDEPITGVLEDSRSDDTLYKFPEGRYYMDRQFRCTGFRNMGFVGKGDATLVPANYWNFADDSYKLFRLGTHYAPGRDLHIQNFNVDFRGGDTGVRPFEVSVSDGLVVKDVDIVGQHDSGTWGPGLFRITDPQGSGLVKRFSAPDGAAPDHETPANFLSRGGPTGILCNWSHQGTIRFSDCVLGPFPDNGLYGSGGSGSIVVDGGRYANSGTASIRLGCDYGKIRGATVTVDTDPFGIPQEGIRLDYGNWMEIQHVDVNVPRPYGEAICIKNSVEGAAVRNTTVRMGRDAHVGIQIDGGTGPIWLLDSHVDIDGSDNAIAIDEGGGEVSLADVRVTGDADGSRMRHAIRCLRDDCDFRRVEVDQPGGNGRRGIALLGENPFLYDCSFTATHRGITLLGDDAWVNDCYSAAYQDGRYSVKVYDRASNPRFKSNDFPDGIVWQ